MTLFQDKYRVESAHLKDYDYSSEGDYYVTICAYDKNVSFGSVENKTIVLNPAGVAAAECWKRLSEDFKNIRLGDLVVMPDHMHGIIKIHKKTDKTLHDMVRAFKSKSGISINKVNGTSGKKVWQKKYYDSVIMGEIQYFFVSEYILNNPLVYEVGKEGKEWYELFEERKRMQDK